ncbi:MAG: ATP-binding protein [Pseudomonadota bacterium]
MANPMDLSGPGFPSGINLAVVGGGRRCLSLLHMLESSEPPGIKIRILGVADINPGAVGLAYARDSGVFTSTDYRSLFQLPGLELVINLTGSRELGRELENSAPDQVTVLPYPASRLLQEIVLSVLGASKRISAQADEITRAQSFARAMAKATIVGVMVLDTNYKVVWINDAGLKAAGLTREEAVGQYCFQVSHQQISPCALPENLCPMKKTLNTHLAAQTLHEHRHKNGRTTYCDVSTYPLFNSEGAVVEVVEVIRDITDDLNEKLERRAEDLKNDLVRLVQEDKLVALGKMVASVAHELNNPICSIINFSKLIKKSLSEGDTAPKDLHNYDKYLELTIREAQRCGAIVGNLLSFARQRAVEPRILDLCEVVDQIIALTRHKMELSNIRLVWDWETKPLEIMGDFTQIQQCVINLVFNAMEAMPQGGVLSIKGGVDDTEGLVWVEISDNGVGMSPETMEYIFEPFFTTKEEGRGVGLGLSMVYGIIREHRGVISVKSEEGKGAVFRIDLPMVGSRVIGAGVL